MFDFGGDVVVVWEVCVSFLFVFFNSFVEVEVIVNLVDGEVFIGFVVVL